MQVRAQSPHLPPARADTSGQSSPGSSTQLGLGALPSAPPPSGKEQSLWRSETQQISCKLQVW